MEYALELLNGILAVLVHGWASDLGEKPGLLHELFSNERSYAWAGISSVVFFIVSRYCVERIVSNRDASWRRKIEGWWLEDVKTVRKNHVSLFRISRLRSRHEFVVHGHTLINDGKYFQKFAEWHSISAAFPEADIRGMFYIYQSKIFDAGSGERLVFGLAHLTFYESIGTDRGIFSGSGYLYDSTPGSEELHFEITKITKRLLKQCIGHSRFKDHGDQVSFLRAYARQRKTEVNIGP